MTAPIPAPDPLRRAEEFIENATLHLHSAGQKMPDIAAAIRVAMAADDPDAYEALEEIVVVEAISTRVKEVLRRVRRASTHGLRTSVFHRVIEDTIHAIESGTTIPNVFDSRYAIPGSNVWKRLGDMTRPELLALSRHRSTLARTNAIEAVFFSALAKRLSDDEVTAEEEIPVNDVIELHAKSVMADLGDLPEEELVIEPDDDDEDNDEDEDTEGE